jgi:predicted RNA-binding protein YlxR (DUF448 family)
MKPTNYRRCISCRQIKHKTSFWQVVRLASNHQIQLGRGMGRSAYLCPNAECLALAKGKNRLQSSLRTKVPERIYQKLEERLGDSDDFGLVECKLNFTLDRI